MSDIESDNSSTTSFGDISVCEEIGQLIDQCHQLHEQIHTSFETLNNIKHLVDGHTSINVTYNGVTSDFDELLETLHKEALENIKEKGYSNFGQKLLEVLDKSTFV